MSGLEDYRVVLAEVLAEMGYEKGTKQPGLYRRAQAEASSRLAAATGRAPAKKSKSSARTRVVGAAARQRGVARPRGRGLGPLHGTGGSACQGLPEGDCDRHPACNWLAEAKTKAGKTNKAHCAKKRQSGVVRGVGKKLKIKIAKAQEGGYYFYDQQGGNCHMGDKGRCRKYDGEDADGCSLNSASGRCRKTPAPRKSPEQVHAARVARGKALAARAKQMRQAGTMPARGWGKRAAVNRQLAPGPGFFPPQQQGGFWW